MLNWCHIDRIVERKSKITSCLLQDAKLQVLIVKFIVKFSARKTKKSEQDEIVQQFRKKFYQLKSIVFIKKILLFLIKPKNGFPDLKKFVLEPKFDCQRIEKISSLTKLEIYIRKISFFKNN